MKNKIQQILDIIGMVLISVIIISMNLLIGSNDKKFDITFIAVFFILLFIFLIAKKIVNKKNIIVKNKIDIFTLLFFLSTILPLIFKTYVSYSGTIEFILKYFLSYVFYLTIRNTVTTRKQINILIIVTLIGSFIPSILGLDLLTTQKLGFILDKFDLRYTEDYRLSSIFGYANTMAIYMAFCIILAINLFENIKKDGVRISILCYITFAFYIVYKTWSRAVLVLLIACLGLYFCVQFRKNIIKYWKKVLILGIILETLILTFLVKIGIKYSEPFEVSDESYYQEIRMELDTSKVYEVTLDLIAEVENYDENDAFEVSIVEENQYFFEKTITAEEFNNYSGQVTLKFTPPENYQTMDIYIKNRKNGKVTVNKCYIDGKEYILNYKYIPNSIGRLFRSFSRREKGIKQRFDFYENCIRIFKIHPIIGNGGNAWKSISTVYQDYPYLIKETHSYFFELLISYGLIGTSLYLITFIFINIKTIKLCLKNKRSISMLLAYDLLMLHSLTFDFNMSFILIQLISFGYMAINIYDDESENINLCKFIEYVTLIALFIVSLVDFSGFFAEYFIKDDCLKAKIGFYNRGYIIKSIYFKVNTDENYDIILQEIQKLLSNEPYSEQTSRYQLYYEIIDKNIDKMEENEVYEYMNWIADQLNDVETAKPMFIDTLLDRNIIIENMIILLKKYSNSEESIKIIKKLSNLLKEELPKYEDNILDIERNGKNEEFVKEFYKKYKKIAERDYINE